MIIALCLLFLGILLILAGLFKNSKTFGDLESCESCEGQNGNKDSYAWIFFIIGVLFILLSIMIYLYRSSMTEQITQSYENMSEIYKGDEVNNTHADEVINNAEPAIENNNINEEQSKRGFTSTGISLNSLNP